MAAAALAALAVVLSVAAARSGAPDPRVVDVVVAARDLVAGSTLTGSDLEIFAIPEQAAPPGALTSMGAGSGRRLVGPIGRGEVVTASRLVPDSARVARIDGLVVVHLLSDDAAALDLVGPGDLVTLYPSGGGAALTRSGLVVSVDPVQGAIVDAWTAQPSSRGLVVAVPAPLADGIFAGERADLGPPVVSVIGSGGTTSSGSDR